MDSTAFAYAGLTGNGLVDQLGADGSRRLLAFSRIVRLAPRETLYAPGDSEFKGTLIPTIEQSLWSRDYRGDISSFVSVALAKVWADAEKYDIIHSHVETLGFLFARHCETPVVSTLHGRLDQSGAPELIEEFSDIPLIAISDSQRRFSPDANWVATIHHGLPLEQMPFSERTGEYLAFVGRITPEKGIADLIELARRTKLPLKIAAKVYDLHEQEHFAEVVEPALADKDLDIEFLGELGERERDPVFAGALATIMLGAWPEPFGLVAIESMATGTPVIARRAGGLTETVEHGVNGFLVDDLTEAKLAVQQVAGLDRRQIREAAIERFSPERMAREYEDVYRELIDRPAGTAPRRETRREEAPATEPKASATEPEPAGAGS